ncbi:MAG: anion permease, partial [Acidimicrobiales bacterium]|nr:anion permease [Acidimicrobiales bacterium]
SATANLLVPIAVTLAGSGAVAVSPALAAVVIAGGCSLAMALPVSTPPNAVAYATGVVSARDLLAIGAVVGLVGGALVAGLAPPVWEALGLLP